MKTLHIPKLAPHKYGLALMLLLPAVVSVGLSKLRPRRKERPTGRRTPPAPKTHKEAEVALDRAAEHAVTEEAAMREQIAKTVREIMDENGLSAYDGDTELKRFVSMYLLLREQGYLLSVAPTEKVLDFEKKDELRHAA